MYILVLVVLGAGLARAENNDLLPKCPDALCYRIVGVLPHGRHFGEADTTQANRDGIWLVGAELAGGTLVELGLSGDRFYAQALEGDAKLQGARRQFTGAELEGMTLWFGRDGTDEQYQVVVNRFYPETFQLWEGAPDPVEAFDLIARQTKPDATDFEWVCSGDRIANDPRWSAAPHAAMLFGGDQLDRARELVTAPSSPTMFNIACMGSAMARMHLTRHTSASNHDGQFLTTYDQRNAMVKMLDADYCGTGQSFSDDLAPVVWMDNTGWAQPALDPDPGKGQVSSVEAIWGPSGAVCLDVPRQVLRAQIPCQLPPCTDFLGWPSLGHIISANPSANPK